MNKAIMYLLLALGVSLGVLFVGGAVMGFAAGFIDGWNEVNPGTTAPTDLMAWGIPVIMLLLCAVLHWVFLHFGFASYSAGRVPKEERWKVYVLLMLALGGMALLNMVLYNPLAEPDGTLLTGSDTATHSQYVWMKAHPLTALVVVIAVEATLNLVIYGGVLRELLEWKHRPLVIITVYSLVMAAFSAFSGSVLLMIPGMMVAQIEGWTYECGRSVIPIIVGDAFYWLLMILLLGTPLSGWFFLPAAAIIVPSAYYLMNLLERYKPID